MWATTPYLEQCAKLRDLGAFPEVRPGMRLARGFADLGYEEFLLLPQNRLVSLFTGERSQVEADWAKHFFVVPDCGELAEEIVRLGFDIEAIECSRRLHWRVSLRRVADGKIYNATEPDICLAFTAAFLAGLTLESVTTRS